MQNTNKRVRVAELYQEGFSMAQIAERLHMSASGIRHHLDGAGVKRRSIKDAITQIHITRFGKKKFSLKQHLSKKDEMLNLVGVMLYWGEGGKTGNTVTFTNNDPYMIQVFLAFLRNICGISEERIRPLVHGYEDQDLGAVERFWSHITKIPNTQFYRSTIHKSTPRKSGKKSLYGTLAINYSDALLLKTILQWIDGYREQFINVPE